MKKIICGFCSLAILVMCLSGCGGSSGNPFTADDAKKGQIGDLCYVVPSNAVQYDDSDNNNIKYRVPIENSAEEYRLYISCSCYNEEDAKNTEEVLEDFENFVKLIEEMENAIGIKYEKEDIDEFAGVAVDKGIKFISEESVSIIVVKSRTVCNIKYSVKKEFYDQSTWDNFIAQLKFVGSDNIGEE